MLIFYLLCDCYFAYLFFLKIGSELSFCYFLSILFFLFRFTPSLVSNFCLIYSDLKLSLEAATGGVL